MSEVALRTPGLTATKSFRRVVSYAAFLPLLFVLFGYILLPTIDTVLTSVRADGGADAGRATFEYWRQFFTYSKNVEALGNTLLLGLATVAVCGVIGTALAFFVHSFEFPGRRFVDILLLAPVMLPGVTITIAFMMLYGESGMVTKAVQFVLGDGRGWLVRDGFRGILFIHAYTQYIFFYINVSAALKRLDRSAIEAAQSLGASKLRVFTTVTLPLLTPALVASAVLTFMSGVGSFAAPHLLGGSFRVMTVQILMAKVNNYFPLAAVQGLMLSFISVVFLFGMRWYENRRDYTLGMKGVFMQRKPVTGTGARAVFFVGAALIALFIALPVITIFVVAFVKPGTWVVDIYPRQFGLDNFVKFFSHPRVFRPFLNSITMSAWATGFAIVVGTTASYVIVKTRLRLRWLVEVLVLLPWALPASTVAINMITSFNRPNPFAFGAHLVGTYWILPITYFVGMLTLVVRTTSASLLQLHSSVEEASRNLGASWTYTFRRIVIPMVAPGVAAGALLGFVGALGDYTSSALLYTVTNMPISIAMTNAMYNFDLGLSMTYGVMQIVVTFAVISAARASGAVGEFRF